MKGHSYKEAQCYIAHLRDYRMLRPSSSGGVFFALAKYIIEEKNGVVIGARWSDNLIVQHVPIDSIDKIPILQGSKYIQSDTYSIFAQTKQVLDNGRWVLFSGTPCQVAALYAFLKKEYERLITVDIICHGVASPGFFERYKKETMNRYGPILSFYFRTRRKIGKSKCEFVVKRKFASGKEEYVYYENDVFLNMYLKGYIDRISCYSCKYASLERISDITIGDCDCSEKYGNKFHNISNSTVMLHTQKAKDIWRHISGGLVYDSLDILLEAKFNMQLTKPVSMPPKRIEIFKELSVMSWEKINTIYAVPGSRKTEIKNKLRLYIPYSVSFLMNRIKKERKS